MVSVEQLQQVSLFENLSLEDIEALLKIIRKQTYTIGQVIFEKDDEGDCMYIILEGRIRIFIIDDDGNELTLTYYGKNELFGELALLDSQPRSASADAADPLEVLALCRQDFLNFLDERPSVGISMMLNLTSRVRYTTRYLEKVLDSVHWLSQGEYERAIEEINDKTDEQKQTGGPRIQDMITSFVDMIQSIQNRETSLKQKIKQLRIKIDQQKRLTIVEEITSSGFFIKMETQLEAIRANKID